MKLISTAILFLSFHAVLYAQMRTISGRLTADEDGSGLPGVNVVQKGTTNGTVTDIDGNYSIEVPVGATLVFSFIGLQTREVVVTENNLVSTNPTSVVGNIKIRKGRRVPSSIPRSLYNDSIGVDEVGVGILNDQTPTYRTKSTIEPRMIRKIKKQGDFYRIRSDNDDYRPTGFALTYTTSLGVEKFNRLPSFQNQFSQGRTDGTNLQWVGADQGEIFSWGPPINTLEFDGSNFPYDNNGALVVNGSGTGSSARAYNAQAFFRKGITSSNSLTVTKPIGGISIWTTSFENQVRTGIIPNSEYQRLNFRTGIKDLKVGEHLGGSASIILNQSTGNLVSRGANLTSVIGSVYGTPVTFDNTNGKSPSVAVHASDSYRLTDGSIRSNAPGRSDNPFGLVNELPDKDELRRVVGALNLQYSGIDNIDFIFNGSFDREWSSSRFGTPPGYAGFVNGRLTERDDNQTLGTAILTSRYHALESAHSRVDLGLSYQLQYMDRYLDRRDGYNFQASEVFGELTMADSLISLDRKSSRIIHEICTSVQFDYDYWLRFRLTNRNYFSNTLASDRYVNLFPSANLSIKLTGLGWLWSIDYLNVYAMASRTMREAPLLYSNWSHGSTGMPLANYSQFYEATEVVSNRGLSPEIETKFETGFQFQEWPVKIQFAYFANRTNDFLIPVGTPDGFQFANAASILNTGAQLAAGIDGGFYVGGDEWSWSQWGINLTWSKYNSVVDELYSSAEWIPMAGFQSVQSVLAQGQPVGAIYGTTYQKTSDGQIVIGNDGFPIEESRLSKIGSPIPDWVLGLSSNFELHRFKLSFLVDFKYGGQMWNGTKGVLDYIGKSSDTGEQRETSNYVFDGVNMNGDVNTIPVDFYNPANPITSNRWVRYGWDGVGEELIEDASWIRLSEVMLTYSTPRRRSALIKNLAISLVGRNLLLNTPYSGVDPSSPLFGYSTGQGLDLFNMPSTRSYNAVITLKM